MTEDTPQTIVDQTRWPEREEDATADALIVHGARLAMGSDAIAHELMQRAFTIDKDSPERKPALRRWERELSAMITDAQVVIALIEAQKASPAAADALARRLWMLTEDGGVLPELMWEALDDRGIDADAALAAAEKAATEWAEDER